MVRLVYARYLITKDNRVLGSCSISFKKLPYNLINSKIIKIGSKNQLYCNNLCVFESIASYFYNKKIGYTEIVLKK